MERAPERRDTGIGKRTGKQENTSRMKRAVKPAAFDLRGLKYKAGCTRNRNSALRTRQEKTRFTRFSFNRKHLKINTFRNDRKKRRPYL